MIGMRTNVRVHRDVLVCDTLDVCECIGLLNSVSPHGGCLEMQWMSVSALDVNECTGM